MKRQVTGCALFLFLLPAGGFPQQSSASVQAEVKQGLEALKGGDLSAAEQHLSAALKLDPTLAEVRANLGLAYYADRQYSKAATEFQEALKRDGSLQTAKSFLPLSQAAAAATSGITTFIASAERTRSLGRRSRKSVSSTRDARPIANTDRTMLAFSARRIRACAVTRSGYPMVAAGGSDNATAPNSEGSIACRTRGTA